jgi:hypothetical protein
MDHVVVEDDDAARDNELPRRFPVARTEQGAESTGPSARLKTDPVRSSLDGDIIRDRCSCRVAGEGRYYAAIAERHLGGCLVCLARR